MVPDRQPTNILLPLFGIILFLNFTLSAPLSGNAPQQIAQCPGNGIYGYLNGTQVGKRQDYIHLEMEDLDLEECIKQCYGNHFCYSIYYDETIKNRCVFYYYAGYNCTGKPLVPTFNLKYEGKPITLDCIRCPAKGDIVSTTQTPIVGNVNVGSSSNGVSVDDDKIKSIEGANINDKTSNTETSGDSSSSGKINQIPNGSDNSSCIIEFVLDFEDVGDEVEELFTNVVNDIKDEKECAKLCYNSNCDYAMYKPSTKTCSYISDYIGFVKNCSSKPLQNFVLGVMDSKNVETIQIECIRCRQNHIEDVKNILDNQIKHSISKNNEGEWQSMTVDPGDAVTWPTNLQLSGHCVVVFQVDESEERIKNLQFTNETQLQTVEQCAAHCYKSSCSNAVFEFLEHGKGNCKISTTTGDVCNNTLQHHYRFYTTKTVAIQCIRCLAKKPTTQSPLALIPGVFEMSTTTSIPEAEKPTLSPEQQYESGEGGKSETKMITSPDGNVDKGGEIKDDDDEIIETSHKTANPPSSAPLDEEQVRSGVTSSISTTIRSSSNEQKDSKILSTTEMSMTESTTNKEKMTTEGLTTTTSPSLTTIQTPVENKTLSQQTKEKEDPYLRSCVVTFQVKPFSLDDEPKDDEPLMEYEFVTDSVTICASKCYNNGCTGAIYNAATNKCVLQLGKELKCLNTDTYNNYFPEKNEKIRIFCLSCTPNNFKGIEGQIKSNKNGDESTTIVSKIEINTVASRSDESNDSTSSPSIKPGSVFEKIATKPKEESEITTTSPEKENDGINQSPITTTVDQSIETTTLSIKGDITGEVPENKETTTFSSGSTNENETSKDLSNAMETTTRIESENTKTDQTTPVPSNEEEGSEALKIITTTLETEEKESGITTITPDIPKDSEKTTAVFENNKEIESTTFGSDVEGSGISSVHTLNENEEEQKGTTSISENTQEKMETTIALENEKEGITTITSIQDKEKSETTTAIPEDAKKETETTVFSEIGNEEKVTILSTEEEESKTTTSISENAKEHAETTILPESENEEKSITTTVLPESLQKEVATTLTTENEKEQKTSIVDSKNKENESQATTSVTEKAIEVMETTISSESEKTQTVASVIGEENKATTSIPEFVNEKIETTVTQESESKLETTTNVQEFEQETTPKKSSDVEKTSETTTNNPELGLEISKDKEPNRSEKVHSPESMNIEPTSIKPEGLEIIFESTTAVPEDHTKSEDLKTDNEVATTLHVPSDSEKILEIGKGDAEVTTQKSFSKNESNTNESIEGSGDDEIEGKVSTVVQIKGEPVEETIHAAEETKSTIIPIIDSNQNTENLFPEEKKSTTESPTNIETTTSPSEDAKEEDKEKTTISSLINEELSTKVLKIDDNVETTTIYIETEQKKLETVAVTDSNMQTTVGSINPETTTFSLPEMGLEISKDRGLQATEEKVSTSSDNNSMLQSSTPSLKDLNTNHEENVKSETKAPKIKDEDETQEETEGIRKLETTSVSTEFEKGEENKSVIPESEKESSAGIPTAESEKQNVETTIVPEKVKETDESKNIPEEAKENESTTVDTEKVTKSGDETTIIPETENEKPTTTVPLESKIGQEESSTVVSELEKEDKNTSAVSEEKNEGLLTTVKPDSETTVEAIDFESENKKVLTTVSIKESDITTVAPINEVTDVSSILSEDKNSKQGTTQSKETDELTTNIPEDGKDKFSEKFVETTKLPEKNIPEIVHTVEEGSGENLENETGEPTISIIEHENEEATTIATNVEENVTKAEKISPENETIEPSTVSSGSDFIATTPSDVEEFKGDHETTTLSSPTEKSKKPNIESTALPNEKNKEEEIKSSTELVNVDFENFGEKEMTLQTTSSPKKDEEPDDSQKKPEHIKESDMKQTISFPENKERFGGNQTTILPEEENESGKNEKQSKNEEKQDIESSGTELVDNQEFSSNNTDGLPEMGLEISRFRGLSENKQNKIQSTTTFPKTSLSEDEGTIVTISTETSSEREKSTLELEKKLDTTTIGSVEIEKTENVESSGLGVTTQSSVIESETTAKTKEEFERTESTIKEIPLESSTINLPEVEGSGIDEASKIKEIELTTINVDHESKKTEELFPDDEQIERIRAQSSTTKLISETTSATTESSGIAFVTDNGEEKEEKGTPTSILFETTLKSDFNLDLSTIKPKIDGLKEKQTSIQVTETLVTTTAIPIDEQLFTIQPFKGLDSQSTKKSQTTNDLTTIPVNIKEDGHENKFATTPIPQTGNQEMLTKENVLETTIIPKIENDNDNEDIKTSTISSNQSDIEGSGKKVLTSTTIDTIVIGDSQTTVSPIKIGENDLTTINSLESKNEGSGEEIMTTTIETSDTEDNIKTTIVPIESKEKESHIETTVPTILGESTNEDTTIVNKEILKGIEQEDSKVTTEPLSHPESIDFDFSGKTSMVTEGKVDLTTISTLQKEEHFDLTTTESSGEEIETTTLKSQKSDSITGRPEAEDEELVSTILPLTKTAIVDGESKTTPPTLLSGDFEEKTPVKNFNTTTLEKASPEENNLKVIITDSTVKTILNETVSNDEDKNEENAKSTTENLSNQKTNQTIESSLETTESKNNGLSTKEVESEGPAFVTEAPESSETKEEHIQTTEISPVDDVNKSTSGQKETSETSTTSLPASTESSSIEKQTIKPSENKIEELIPEEKKKEEEIDVSKIDFTPTTTIQMAHSNDMMTTIEPVKSLEDEKEIQSTTSTIITEDDGSVIDTSILKTGKVDSTNPVETDVTLISGDSVVTTLKIKNENEPEITTIKTSFKDKTETTSAEISTVAKSTSEDMTTIASEESKIDTNITEEAENKQNEKSTTSQAAFITEKTESTTAKVESKSEENISTKVNVEATTISEEIIKKITVKPDSKGEIESADMETTVLPKSEGVEFVAKENTKSLVEEKNKTDKNIETTIAPISETEETANKEEDNKKETLSSQEVNVKSHEDTEKLTTQLPEEEKSIEFGLSKKVEETTAKSDVEKIETTIVPEDKSSDIKGTTLESNVEEIETTISPENKLSDNKDTKPESDVEKIETTITPKDKSLDTQTTLQPIKESTGEPIKTETIDFVGETTTISGFQKESTINEFTTTEATSADTKPQGTAESIDSASIDKNIDLPKTVGKVDSPQPVDGKTSEEDSEEKTSEKEDYEDKILIESKGKGSQEKEKVHTTTEPPVAAVADLVHTLSRTNDLDLLLRGASKQLVNIRKNSKCGVNNLRFTARAMKDFSQEYEVIESVPSLYACLEACYVAGCKKAAFVPYPQPKCLMHYELGSKLTNSCTSSSIYQLTTHWHFSNPSEVIEILCLVCDNDGDNSKEKLQIENVFSLLIDDKRKGMEQQAFMTEVCHGAGRLEFQVKPVSKYPRLNITHDVPANSPAECAMKCKENGHCDLAGFVPSPHAKSSGLCLLTSDTHYCDYDDERYKHVPQHQSEVPFLLHCIKCSKCRYNLSPVIPGITEVIPFETTKTANNIEECALQCSESNCTTAQFNPRSSTCSTTINPSFKNICPTEKAIQVDGNLQIRLHCVSCTN